jgi:hypothetical protein
MEVSFCFLDPGLGAEVRGRRRRGVASCVVACVARHGTRLRAIDLSAELGAKVF